MQIKSWTIRNLAVAILVSNFCALGQPPVQNKQDAKDSPCANVLALAGPVNMNCSSLTPEQQRLIASIPLLLHKLLVAQGDTTSQILNRLDACVSGVTELKEGYWVDPTSKQLDGFVSTLNGVPGLRVEIIVGNGDNHNREKVANALRSALRTANWEATIFHLQSFLPPNAQMPRGIEISAKQDSPTIQVLAKALIDVFGKVNVTGYLATRFLDPSSDVAITIWPKP
jgi:hypothetical protein